MSITSALCEYLRYKCNCTEKFRRMRNECIVDVEHFVRNTCEKRPNSHNYTHMTKVRNNALWILDMIDNIVLFSIYVLLLIMTKLLWINDMALIILIFTSLMIYSLAYILSNNRAALFLIVEIVALLHDVADHKYVEEDETLLPKLDKFLETLTSNIKYHNAFETTMISNLFNAVMIKNIIDRISYSRQKKYGMTDWTKTLGTFGILVRNIVSDADKFEAIGKKGIDRCIEYTQELHLKTQKSNLTKVELIANVEQHYHDKLKHLVSRTYMKTIPGYLYGKILDIEMRRYMNAKIHEYKNI